MMAWGTAEAEGLFGSPPETLRAKLQGARLHLRAVQRNIPIASMPAHHHLPRPDLPRSTTTQYKHTYMHTYILG